LKVWQTSECSTAQVVVAGDDAYAVARDSYERVGLEALASQGGYDQLVAGSLDARSVPV
jgi:hypothetical protein